MSILFSYFQHPHFHYILPSKASNKLYHLVSRLSIRAFSRYADFSDVFTVSHAVLNKIGRHLTFPVRTFGFWCCLNKTLQFSLCYCIIIVKEKIFRICGKDFNEQDDRHPDGFSQNANAGCFFKQYVIRKSLLDFSPDRRIQNEKKINARCTHIHDRCTAVFLQEQWQTSD